MAVTGKYSRHLLYRRYKMYSNAGYLYSVDDDIVDMEHPLTVTCCGIYKLIHRKVMCTSRPSGRLDYQLLYVVSGKAYFYFEEETLVVSAGHMVLYRPDIAQLYEYFLEDSPEVCWVHFTGYEAEELLDKTGFSNTVSLYCGVSHGFQELFSQMIRELQLKRPCFEDLLPLYLRQLFTKIQRSCLEVSSDHYRCSKEIASAIHYFNEAFSREISIENYALSQHMSVCWFIRSFKRYTGVTPLQYITTIRINKAKELLKDSGYSIQEIGSLVGYDNQLYFSRMFKKQTGCSPSQYREK